LIAAPIPGVLASGDVREIGPPRTELAACGEQDAGNGTASVGAVPIVSVVTAAYNVEAYAAEAVESILGQSFRDFEFLIIDDGSTDGTLAVLRRYAEQDSRIRLWSRQNLGIVASANELIDRARGEFIARIDADDVAMPDRLECQVNHLRDHPQCLAVGSQALLIDPEGDPLCTWFTSQARGGLICHGTSMIRRHALIEVGKYNPRFPLASDLDLFLRLAEHGRLDNIPKTLLKYRMHLGSVSHREPRRQMDLAREIMLEALRRRNLAETDLRVETRDASRTPCPLERKWGWWALSSGHVRTARKHAWRAFRSEPFSIESMRLLYCALRGR
jgi:glycosyltransferase involved in cell wall biosynthesis